MTARTVSKTKKRRPADEDEVAALAGLGASREVPAATGACGLRGGSWAGWTALAGGATGAGSAARPRPGHAGGGVPELAGAITNVAGGGAKGADFSGAGPGMGEVPAELASVDVSGEGVDAAGGADGSFAATKGGGKLNGAGAETGGAGGNDAVSAGAGVADSP